MTRIVLDNTITENDLIEFELFNVKDRDLLETKKSLRDLEASDRLVNYVLQQSSWKAYKSLDFITRTVTIGYDETDSVVVNGDGLTEADAYDLWIDKFKEKERRFKSIIPLASMSQTSYDALLGLYVVTGSVTKVGTDVRTFDISDYIKQEKWQYVGTALVLTAEKRIFCQGLAKILMLADYHKYKERSLFKEQGIQEIRKAYPKDMIDDQAKKQAELIYYKETDRFLPKMTQSRMRQIVKRSQ